TSSPASHTALDALYEPGHLVVDLSPLLHEGGDLLDGVNDGGVVAAAELACDGRVAEVGQLTEDVHADLTGGDQGAAPAGAAEVLHTEAEGLRRGIEDDPGCDLARLGGEEDVGQDLLGDVAGEGLAVEAGVGGDADERPLELTDVVLHVGGDEV